MKRWFTRSGWGRLLASSFVCLILFFGFVAKVAATELIIFESSGCVWCETWNEEIGDSYDKTTEAQSAPLRRVDVDDHRPDDLNHINGIVYTPTFVMIKDGSEVGRIIGYPGEDFFWQLLNELIVKANGKTPDKS